MTYKCTLCAGLGFIEVDSCTHKICVKCVGSGYIHKERNTMSETKFKTLRHIETVRNYISYMVVHLLGLSLKHDQSKLQEPQASGFDKYTNLLKDLTYGSEEYKKCLEEMKPFLDNHYAEETHHPESYPNGIKDMNLLDIVEMIADWKSAALRHKDGNIFKSIDINQKRFGYSDELKIILVNTAKLMESWDVVHHADES